MSDEQDERDFRRQEAVRKAVQAADRIIVDQSDGTVEELDYLTAQVAMTFFEKTIMRTQHALLRKDLEGGFA